jgi:glycosyltransferase involved in cell wall biosynthesis
MATALIPAYNEEPRVAAVVQACWGCDLVSQVVVVDDGSDDGTAEAAEAAGATVVRQENGGIGSALVAGALAAHSPVLVRLDADLYGLRASDVERLLRPVVTGAADMAIAEPDGVTNPLWWSGQRALPTRWILEVQRMQKEGYGADMLLTRYARQLGARIVMVPWPGVRSAEKREKWGTGAAIRLGVAARVAAVESWESGRSLGLQAALAAVGIAGPYLLGLK